MDHSEHDDLADFICQMLRAEGPDAVEAYFQEHPAIATEGRAILPSLMLLEGMALQASGERASEKVPQRIGDFRIVREIGRGGMGVVYEALQMSLDRRVALKVLPRQTFEDEVQVERFRREARAAARLRHDHIVPVYGISSHEGLHFYVMQFIEGHGLDDVIRDLRDRNIEDASTEKLTAAISAFYELKSDPTSIGRAVSSMTNPTEDASDRSQIIRRVAHQDRSRRPDARTVAKLGVQVADALAHAHAEGLLHRDIKPSNLILDAEGRCWVTDFGLVKDHQADDITHSGEIVGTLRYMAPERFRGWADPRSDIYAVGLVLYELLLLQPAFLSSDKPSLIREILEETPVPPRRIDSAISRDFETIVLKAIDKEPTRRYATARDLVTDLENFLEGRPLMARRTGPISRAIKWSRRHPYPTALIVLVVVATSAFLVNRVEHAQVLESKNRQLQFALNEVRVAQEGAETEHLEARKFFDQLTIRLANELRDLPMGEIAREKILADALQWYRDRLSERSHDPKLALETTSALQALASIEQSLGQADDAAEHLREALTILGERGDAEFRTQAARLLGDLARVMGRIGKVDESASLYLKAIEKIERELAEKPNDRLLLRNRAELLNNLARSVTLYDKPRALLYQRQALTTLEPLMADEALSVDRRQYATLASNLAIDLHLLGQSEEGLEFLGKALEALAPHMESDVGVGQFAEALASVYLQRAVIAFESGLPGDVLGDYEKARNLLDDLVARHPDRFDHRERRSQVLNNMAVVYLNRARSGSAEDNRLARELLKQALADQELLYQRAPGPELALSYARSLGNASRQILVDDASSTEELRRAREWYDRAIDLLDENGSMADARVERLSLSSNMGIIAFMRGDEEEGARILESLVASLDELIESLPERPEVKHIAAGALSNYADILIEQKKMDLAESYIMRGLEYENELLQRQPEAPELRLFKRNLLLTFIRGLLQTDRYADLIAKLIEIEDLIQDQQAQGLVLSQIGQAVKKIAADTQKTEPQKRELIGQLRSISERIDSRAY